MFVSYKILAPGNDPVILISLEKKLIKNKYSNYEVVSNVLLFYLFLFTFLMFIEILSLF